MSANGANDAGCADGADGANDAYPKTWEDFLAAPAFVINLARCPKRWEISRERLAAAGFTDVRRWEAVDAGSARGTEEGAARLAEGWKRHGSPPFAPGDKEFKVTYLGKQGCMLSHLDLMKHIADPANGVSYAIVFEDDVLVHPRWAELAPTYYAATPRDYDLVFAGSQMEMRSEYSIAQVPCFCTNAMAMPRDGARRVYEFLLGDPAGVRTIDCMLKDHQEAVVLSRGAVAARFNWYVWNATMFPAAEARMPKGWTKRNTGLIFQDGEYVSEVRPW